MSFLILSMSLSEMMAKMSSIIMTKGQRFVRDYIMNITKHDLKYVIRNNVKNVILNFDNDNIKNDGKNLKCYRI